MMKNLKLFTPVLALMVFCAGAGPARAQEDARAAWQVTRYDVTANAGATGAAERALQVRATVAARNVGQAGSRTFTVRVAQAANVTAARAGDAAATFTTREDARTRLRQVTVNLPATVTPNGSVQITLDYTLPVSENTGFMAISPEGSQFLPQSQWYPTPNTAVSVRGADTAPFRLTVAGVAGGETVVTSGRASGTTYEQTLNGQPFFLTGRWEAVEGAGEARNISAHIFAGAGAEERRQAEALIALAAAARSFYAGMLGAAPDAPFRLVAVRRGGGFDDAGTLLLDASAFRRSKVDSATAMMVAEAVARMWVGGAAAVRGEGAGVVREGLARHLANQFLERQYGREAAEAERLRQRMAYAAIAQRDPPLIQSTPFYDTHFNAAANKGAMVWHLAERALGREAFAAILNAQLEAGRAAGLTLSGLRAALAERGGEPLRATLVHLLDQPTDMDLLIGVPQQRGGEWVAALRNLGGANANVTAQATTAGGQKLTVEATIPARDFGEARFRTTERIVRVEIDPDKLYPQVDYANDVAPRAPAPEEALLEAKRSFDRQDYAGAVTAARNALAAAATLQEARILLARALLAQNQNDQAEREFRALVDAPLPLPGALAWGNYGLGEIALRRGQAAEAARRFDEAVRADAEYAASLTARAGRIRAEAAANAAPAPDATARAFIEQLDQAIRTGRQVEIDARVVPGELRSFTRGLVGSQPEVWQTRVLRTEPLGANRLAADVSITTRALGRDQSGTAVFVLARTGNDWRLADVQLFEVR